MSLYKQNLPYPEPGFHFIGFREYLKGTESCGYLTTKKMTAEENDGFYLQAQFALAPVIIKLNDENNKFNIIDSPDYAFIIKTIRENNSLRLDSNKYGQALIMRR